MDRSVATRDDPHAQQPLHTRVSVAGREVLVLRALTRQAIPMLEHPEEYSRTQREQLAQTLACAVRGGHLRDRQEQPPFPSDQDAPPDADLEEYEPGCLG